MPETRDATRLRGFFVVGITEVPPLALGQAGGKFGGKTGATTVAGPRYWACKNAATAFAWSSVSVCATALITGALARVPFLNTAICRKR